MIDLIVLEDNKICYAPYCEVGIGDLVKVHDKEKFVIERTVVDQISTYEENEVFKFFKRNTDISPVLAIVKTIHYEEEANDLSD